MADRYAQDIRRIVGIDETQNELDAAELKAQLLGTRGIGYMSASSQQAVGISGDSASGLTPTVIPETTTSNTENAGVVESNTTVKDSAAEIADGQSKGSMVDPKNPHNSTYEEGQGEYAPEDTIDQTNDFPTISDDVQSGVGALDERSGGTVNAFKDMTDCDTSKDIDIRMDGLFLPPTGWVDADTPGLAPPTEQWVQGINWFTTSPIITTAHIAEDIKTSILAAIPSGYTLTSEALEEPLPGVFRWRFIFDKPSNPQLTYFAQKDTCVVGVDPYCPTDDPTGWATQNWPDDSKMQLVWQDGKFVVHDREPPNDIVPAYTDNQHSQIDFCFGIGRTGTIAPTRTGGFALFETSGGSTTGIVTIFGSDRKVKAYTSGAGLDAYLPL